MKTIFSFTLLVATVLLAVACGGGGGGGSSSSSSNDQVGFRFKGTTGDNINIYGLDGTYTAPSPLHSSTTYVAESDGGYATVSLETNDSYRLRYQLQDGAEILDYLLLQSDFDALSQGAKSLDMGEMNSATTFFTAKAFSELESSNLEKPRSSAANLLVILQDNGFLESKGIDSFRSLTLSNIANSANITTNDLLWINLLAINIKRMNATDTSASEASDVSANWSAVVESVIDIAEAFEADPDNVDSSVYANYISATGFLDDITTTDLADDFTLVKLTEGSDEIDALVDMAQSSDSTTFVSNLNLYESLLDQDDYARLNLQTGDVDFFNSDNLELNDNDSTDFIVFKKMYGSSLAEYRTSDNTTVNINLTDYYIAMTEMTEAQYAYLSDNEASTSSNPVKSVSHADALSAASAADTLFSSSTLSFNLPTEAQWEYAARGVDVSTDDSSTADSANWVCFETTDNLTTQDEPVAERTANSSGLFDMNGNVAEICRDSLTSVSAGASDPVGTTGDDIAIRGGAYINSANFCTVSSKSTASKDFSSAAIGFRLVFTK